jgi:hypothetical protein
MVCSLRRQQRKPRNGGWAEEVPYPWIDTASLRRHGDCRWGVELEVAPLSSPESSVLRWVVNQSSSTEKRSSRPPTLDGLLFCGQATEPAAQRRGLTLRPSM